MVNFQAVPVAIEAKEDAACGPSASSRQPGQKT
eukprot:CAMPEP_0181211038 /NCGR_PEP_ID=MMETSP1096-20121128/23568_1 /TAXON_ID=156174 ORGANISM="Chrysochromulina ericina, Strain CCMP281" /NCGR_SAMPLE_ID=MMETSP1096 /ASSEMBLY_ACC=CAM_ASM_000453 /LENGTH=32 /DNA_ID= /DNA_START= /DNA_END= /DNA_ORIENTATION=